MQSQPTDMMIVDLMLGEMDGFTCIREVRRRNGDLPIVVVSARADAHDIVAGLEAGADDYITKPFEIKELTARLRALGRRAARPAPHLSTEITLDRSGDLPLVLSPDGGVLRRGHETVHLTLTEFRLLTELAAEPGNVLSRQVLLDRIWEQGFFGDERLVDVHIRRLRTKIEPDPSAPRIIVTVRGLGYRLDVQ
jgi:DNA-binding response OmpR family regulator